MAAPDDKVLGAVLAGGQSSRLYPLDKRWLVWRGEPLWWHTTRSLARQCAAVAAIVDTQPERYARFALAAGSDLLVGVDAGSRYQGPLAGVVCALNTARSSGFKWVLTAPCDCVVVPSATCGAMLDAGCSAVYLQIDGQNHYTVALWHTDLLNILAARVATGDTSLRRALTSTNASRITLPVNDQAASMVNINNFTAWRQLSCCGGTVL